MLIKRGGDFVGFDAVAADFDLVIEPAEKGYLAGGQEFSQVAGFEKASAGGGRGEGIRNKAFGGEIGAVAIAAGYAGTAKIDFT